MSSKPNKRDSAPSASSKRRRNIRVVPRMSPAVPHRVRISTMSASPSPPSSPHPEDDCEPMELRHRPILSAGEPTKGSTEKASQSALNSPPRINRRLPSFHRPPEKKQKTSPSSSVFQRVLFARELVHPKNPISQMDQSLLCESISNVLEPIVKTHEETTQRKAKPHTEKKCNLQNDKAGELDNHGFCRGELDPFRMDEPGPSSPCGPYETQAFTETHSCQSNSDSVRSELSLGRSSTSWGRHATHSGAGRGPDSFGPQFGQDSSVLDDGFSFLDDCFPNATPSLRFQSATINTTDSVTTEEGKLSEI